MKALCIYHGNCADGFGAACAVYMALGTEVDFHAGVYQNPPPNVTDRDVILVDFSYKRDVLQEMAEQANSILILDHHKSAQEDLVDLPENVDVLFDMERSGAVITWEYFFPELEVPDLLLYIQDRDLWQFNIPASREVSAGLFAREYDFMNWLDMIEDDDGDIIGILETEGEAILRKQDKDIREFIKAAAYRMEIAGHNVPVLNAPYFWSSDAGHIMGKDEPFAACYWDTPDGRVFSLRSEEGAVDVSEIAKQFGGGGHEHAAGFRINVGKAELVGGGL